MAKGSTDHKVTEDYWHNGDRMASTTDLVPGCSILPQPIFLAKFKGDVEDPSNCPDCITVRGGRAHCRPQSLADVAGGGHRGPGTPVYFGTCIRPSTTSTTGKGPVSVLAKNII